MFSDPEEPEPYKAHPFHLPARHPVLQNDLVSNGRFRASYATVGFPRLLTYQLNSFMLSPPENLSLKATVFNNEEDATI